MRALALSAVWIIAFTGTQATSRVQKNGGDDGGGDVPSLLQIRVHSRTNDASDGLDDCPWATGVAKNDTGLPPCVEDNEFNRYLITGADSEENPDYKERVGLPPPRCSSCDAPTSVGPVFVVYVTYKGRVPTKTVQQVKDELYATEPSYAGVLAHSSWGQSTLGAGDIEFWEMESLVDPGAEGTKPTLATVKSRIQSQQSYWDAKAAFEASRDDTFNLIMYILPDNTYQGTAFVPGQDSRYRGNAIDWGTFTHEVGHNWGLLHAGGLQSDGTYNEYMDQAIMGYQRSYTKNDFNAVARWNLGWVSADQVSSYPEEAAATIRALNEGPDVDGNHLIFFVACAECSSARYSNFVGGNLFISFRVSAAGSTYGMTDGHKLYENSDGAPRRLSMLNRVHVHFQATGQRWSELWSTLDVNENYALPGSASLFIHVCTKESNNLTGTATVGVSSSSNADAMSACNGGSPSPTVTPTATSSPTATPTSSPTAAPTPAPTACSETGFAYVPFIRSSLQTADETECLYRCVETDGCSYYNYKKGRCRFAKATARKVRKSGYVSGNAACSLPPTASPTYACDEVNYAYKPFMNRGIHTTDETECLYRCTETSGCSYYNYKKGRCRFAKATARKVRKSGYVSGNAACSFPPTASPTYACDEVNYAYKPFMGSGIRTVNELECLSRCQGASGCSFYNYKKGRCRFAKATAKKVRRRGYVSGAAACPIPPTLPPMVNLMVTK